MWKFSQRSLDRLATVKPELQILFEEAIKNSPYDFGITHGYRSTEEQQELYAKGRTKAGSIVTYVDGVNKVSRHQLREAVDIVVWLESGITWDPEYYAIVAQHIKNVAVQLNIDIEYGGDWINFKDWPHFQLK